MHELLKHVLTERDLTRAGDIFGIPDNEIVDDLNDVLKQITEISSRPDYIRNDRDQALVEICVARVTSCIKETGTLDKYCGALVALLASCLHHNLMPVGHLRDDDPPHAKIASDIIACIVLTSFPVQNTEQEANGNKAVMELFLPVAVQFLHKGNREISRHMARYLSLAAVSHAALLKPHTQTIMDSIMSGNYPLCRILSPLYRASPWPLEAQLPALLSLLPHAEPVERSALLSLVEEVSSRRPEQVSPSLPALLGYLCAGHARKDPACMCADILEVIVHISSVAPHVVRPHTTALRRAAAAAPPPPAARRLAHALTNLAQHYKDQELAAETLQLVVRLLGTYSPRGRRPADAEAERSALRRLAARLCSAHPALFDENVLTAVRDRGERETRGERERDPAARVVAYEAYDAHPPPRERAPSPVSRAHKPHTEVNRTAGGVTIVQVTGGPVPPAPPAAPPAAPPGGYTRRRLGDSRSTGRLHGHNHRSMTRINVAGGSVGGLHKSMTRLSSSQQINSHAANASAGANASANANEHSGKSTVTMGPPSGVTVHTGAGPPRRAPPQPPAEPGPPHPPRAPIDQPYAHVHANHTGHTTAGPSSLQSQSISVNPLTTKSSDALSSSVSIQHSTPALGHVSVITSSNTSTGAIITQPSTSGIISGSGILSGGVMTQPGGSGAITPGPSCNPISVSGPVTVTSRRNNTSVTMINSSNNSNSNHRISVFEPYPMRDTIQHFCEKHLDKIKAYMDSVSLRLPPPAKCTIEERRSKKVARLQFLCGLRGAHCLFGRGAFCTRTRLPRVWIHLMFLALQARHRAALSSRDHTVASLKHCWDTLKCENKTFLTLVTSAFPPLKEQDMLVNELRAAGFFDVFELSTTPIVPGGAPGTEGEPPRPTQAPWGCFLCTHPERAPGFLAPGAPVIEGQLKEKKGRWRLFRRWRTRYFTLSGAHLSCKGSSGGESIDINQIRSVKVSRGARNIPKAFEIFTGDQTLILKPKDGKDAEQWVQCLSIAVAHSHSTARAAPAKANSLPARGLAFKTF